jgi:hypothetical protein
MKKYPVSRQTEPPELRETATAGKLEFPVDAGFLSLPPRLDPQVMLRRLEETMPWRSMRPGEQERRLLAKVNVEFVL